MLPLLGYIIFLQLNMPSPILKLQALLKIVSAYNSRVFVMLLQVVIVLYDLYFRIHIVDNQLIVVL